LPSATFSKGEGCKASLLADPGVKKHNKDPTVKVMKLDMDDYNSIQSLAKAVKAELPAVDHLLLNAGIGILKHETGPSGHERLMQVKYLSNVLLLLELLPQLEANAAKTGVPSRTTWVGSRRHSQSTLSNKAPVQSGETVVGHMDDPKNFLPFQNYNDTKLLCALFLYELAPRLDRNKVIVNKLCPGMVDTTMSDVLPLYLRVPVNIMKTIRT
jgi:NAD(P)-dependent dehydrogenase (short-subunit alcohol dehydrogenase family)